MARWTGAAHDLSARNYGTATPEKRRSTETLRRPISFLRHVDEAPRILFFPRDFYFFVVFFTAGSY